MDRGVNRGDMVRIFGSLVLFISMATGYGYDPVPGAIPLEFGHYPATDLVCDASDCGEGIQKGDILTPSQAIDYYHRRNKETSGQWNLSELNPVESQMWKDTLGGTSNDVDSLITLDDLDEVQFLSKAAAELIATRLTVMDQENRHYNILIGKTTHNILLRKSLLRKLGYFVPAVKWVKRLKIKFNSTTEMTDFIKDLKINNTADAKRWILSTKANPKSLKEKVELIKAMGYEIPKKLDIDQSLDDFSRRDQKRIDEVLEKNLVGMNKAEIVVQDVVAMEEADYYINLARGHMEQSISQGKRIFDSLILPYALTDIPESINILSWTIGREYNGNIILDYKDSPNFNCSRGDAYWMVRRILKLSEKDWVEIVGDSKLPNAVQMVLIEKLKSRRNHLAHLFNIDTTSFKVNSTISNGDDLVEGNITKPFYEGYGRYFNIDDPETPFAFSDMKAMAWSKGITTGMELLVNAFNTSGFTGTDIGANITKFSEEYLAEQTARSLLTGEEFKTPVKSYAFPMVGGGLILNREIVSGSYMGQDNLIQLVDAIGLSMHVGAFGGLFGVDAKMGKLVPVLNQAGERELVRELTPINLTANARLYYNRVYSHIRPLTSIQKGLKYPFKNVMVPLLKNKYGGFFDGLMNADYEGLTHEQKIEINKKTKEALERNLVDFRAAFESANETYQVPALLEELLDIEKLLNENSDTFISETGPKGVEFMQKLYREINELVTRLNSTFEVIDCDNDNGKVCAVVKQKKKRTIIAKAVTTYKATSERLESLAKTHIYKLQGVQRDQELNEVMELINENIEVGESIMITDSLGGSLTLGGGANLFNVARVNMNVRPDKLIVNRLHLHRFNENEIHVYKTYGNVNGIQYAFQVEKFVPILKVTVRTRKGKAKTDFYKVAIGKTMQQNGRRVVNNERVSKLQGIRHILKKGTVKRLKQVMTPMTITHSFKDNSTKLGIVVARFNWLNVSDMINVKAPSGEGRQIYRHYLGNTRGIDYENYVRDLVDLVIAKAFNADQSITSFNAGNPGFTLFGKAKNRILNLEAFVDEESGALMGQTVQVSNVWNGWQLKKKRALKILEKIKKEYRFRFFEDEVFAQTKKMILYNISANVFVYEPGLKHLLSLTDDQIKKVWTNQQTRDMTNFSGQDALAHSGVERALKFRRKYSEALLQKDYKKMGKYLLKLIRMIDKKLTLQGMEVLVGGKQNLFAIGRIDGFRIGAEDGDEQILSTSFGRIGEGGVSGPVKGIKDFLGMTNQEFTLNWLLGRVL
jgi:hypothetical protein